MPLTLMPLACLFPGLMACACATASTDLGSAQSEPVQSESLAAAKTREIRVIVKGFRNRKGQVLASLFASSKGFPDKGDLAKIRSVHKIGSNKIEAVFKKVAPGTYAVAVLHDEDMDFKMKTGMFGAPKEGYGVSNNVKGRFGPPKFSDAKFKVTGERDVELTISMIY